MLVVHVDIKNDIKMEENAWRNPVLKCDTSSQTRRSNGLF